MTNREWINSMSNEELAKLLPNTGFGEACFSDSRREYHKRCERYNYNCIACKVEFLQEEKKEEQQ